MGLLTRLWQRYVTHEPAYYRAYVNFPVDDRSNAVSLGDVRSLIDDFEHVCEGRLDISVTAAGELVAVTDYVSAVQFDMTGFDQLLANVDDLYCDTHTITRHSRWERHNRKLARTYVVVPVKPLFPDSGTPEEPLAATD